MTIQTSILYQVVDNSKSYFHCVHNRPVPRKCFERHWHPLYVTCDSGTKELRTCCRPTKTGVGPSDARIVAAASHRTGVFLVSAFYLEFSRTLENPHWIRRRRDRPLYAPQARPAHTRQRATGARTMSACLSCVVMALPSVPLPCNPPVPPTAG